MYNTYTNSVLWSIRTKGFHDYSYLLHERSERYPIEVSSSSSSSSSRCCYGSCCCCCCSKSSSSFVKRKILENPRSVVYGLRQSTLIQWPRFRRRLSLGGRDRQFDEHCFSRERYRVGARNKGFRFRVSEESHECYDGDGLDDVEALISLLCEEMGNECSCGKERNRSSSIRIMKEETMEMKDLMKEEAMEMKHNGELRRGNVRKVKIEEITHDGNERSTQKNKREEELERRKRVSRDEYREKWRPEELVVEENYECEHCGRKKESDSGHEYKSDAIESRRETSRKNEEREARLRRTKSSSCSSYYSLSSSGEFESDIEDQDETIGYNRENQKKSKKKIVEVSGKGTQSRKEDSRMNSRRKVDETVNGVSSNYHKQVYEQEGNSNQAVALNRRRRKQYSQTGSRMSESRRNFEEDTEIHEIHVNDMETNSQSGKEEKTVTSVRSETGRDYIGSTQQQNERSGIRYTSEEIQSKYSNRQDEDTNVLQNSIKQRHQSEEKMSTRSGSRQRTENLSEISQIHNINIENRIKRQEVHTSLGSGLHSEVEKQQYHMDQIPSREMHSNENSVSISRTSDVIRVTESQRASEKRVSGQERTTIVQLGGEAKEYRDKMDSNTNSRKEIQTVSGLLGSKEKIFGEASSSQSYSFSQNRIQQVNLDSEEVRESQTVLIPPSSQLVNRGSRHSFQTDRASIQDVNYEAGARLNSESVGELMRITAHEDALGSAEKLEQSSEQFIGEFIEKAKHEASSLEIQGDGNEKLKQRDSRKSSGGSGGKGPSDEMWVTDSVQVTPQPSTAEGNATDGNAIVKRSGRSLWSIIADIARLRWSPRTGTPDLVAKTGGKSSPDESISSATWFSGREHDGSSDDNIKGDKIVLLQESESPHQLEIDQIPSGSRFESSNSLKLRRNEVSLSSSSSGKLEVGSGSVRLSSMSGDHSLGVDDDGRRVPETEATETPLLLPTRSLRRSPAIKDPSESRPAEASGGQSAGKEEGKSFQTRIPTTGTTQKPSLLPVQSLRRSPAIKEPSESRPAEASGGQSAGKEEGKSFGTRIPTTGTAQKPSLLPIQSPRSPVIQETPESHLVTVSGRSSVRVSEEQEAVSVKSHEETGSSIDSVLKQRKLQRKKQVVRDKFDEWEEAYKIEAERRKTDEMFMREALIEAKKAAEIWEVPVGAVLVHDGKIIARGCNLVEDLRDSTAHAEMICIREASKVLQSWRLADTTLYVTLEPCPMCAGAILQARVNTLVWGAPNKLLGADGSWIRLFPGAEGNGSEASDKPPAPVHPFHPKMTIRRGVLESECAETMQQFFQLRRKKKDKTPDKNSDPLVDDDAHHHHHHHPSKLLNKMHQIFPFFCL